MIRDLTANLYRIVNTADYHLRQIRAGGRHFAARIVADQIVADQYVIDTA